MADNRTKKNRPEAISKEKVQELRQLTGEGMMCCLKALKKCEGNMEEAVQYLKESGNCKLVYRKAI